MSAELEGLRSVAERVHPPAFAELEQVARRRDRRAVVTSVAGLVVAALVVVAGAVAIAGSDDAAPDPVITPTPTPPTPAPTLSPGPTPEETPAHRSETSMTPEEVVGAGNAELRFAGVSAEDPDFRVSVWVAECTWCPERFEGSRPTFAALAVTTDGYATATYRRPPFPALRPFYVHSPAPGVLMVVDDSNGGEWLVREDGSVSRRLPRVVDERTIEEPRQWFHCLSTEVDPPDYLATWCALDVATGTVVERRGAWTEVPGAARSVVSPALGVEPYGTVPRTDRDLAVTAWWDQDGIRHTRVLAVPPDPADNSSWVRGGGVLSATEDLLYWTYQQGSEVLELHVGDDGGDAWRTLEQALPAPANGVGEIVATPEGTLIMRHRDEGATDGRTTIWRLDSLEEGEWELVHDTGPVPYGLDAGAWQPLTVVGDRLVAGFLYSDDDGQTWTQVTEWR